MCTYLYDFSFIQHHNLVGIADGRKTMCYDNHRLPLIEIRKIFSDGSLVIRIKGIGGFIQEDEHWILIDYPCNKDALSLPD